MSGTPGSSSAITPQRSAGLEVAGLWGILSLLWLQLFWALVPTWRDGEYYGYGWFVPVLAAGLAWRRWQLLVDSGSLAVAGPRGLSTGLLAFACGCLVVMIPLRIIAVADPTWRPPLLLHVGIVVLLTHLLLAKSFGRRIALGMVPVTVFALSAVPYPWQIEYELINRLTAMVIFATHEVFLLAGYPVEQSGTRLILGAEAAEVSEGCSGIRSLQSLVMVALFFGELLDLTVLRRVVLLFVAGACAVVFNTLRAYRLADIQFASGQEAAAAAHDMVGHAAYGASALVLFLSAVFFLRCGRRRRRVIRRSRVARAEAAPSTAETT
jgi:exosortase